ncbi:MAG: PEGA domain-containing protein [bacterium]
MISLNSFAAELGSLSVTAGLQPADLYLDNISVGSTPLYLEKVQVGQHLIVAKREGKEVFRRSILIKSAELSEMVITVGETVEELDNIEQADKKPSHFQSQFDSLSDGLIFEKPISELKLTKIKPDENKIEEPEIEPSQVANISSLLRKPRTDGLSLGLSYSSLSITGSTAYSYESVSGMSGLLSYPFRLFDIQTCFTIEGIFTGRGYMLPVTLDFLSYNQVKNELGFEQFFGLGVGVYPNSIEEGVLGTGWRFLAGASGLGRDKNIQMLVADDFIKMGERRVTRLSVVIGIVI